MSSTEIQISNLEEEISEYISKLNNDVGYYWWQRYIYSAFWSNISTPINLCILLLTSLTTGQSISQNLISQDITSNLGILALIVSLCNTFFKPYEQLTSNQKILNNWANIGNKLDEIYYDEAFSLEEKKVMLKNLEDLFKEMLSLKRNNDNNYFIDLIYLIIRVLCVHKPKWSELKHNRNWHRNLHTNTNTNTNTNTTSRNLLRNAETTTNTNSNASTNAGNNLENTPTTINNRVLESNPLDETIA